MSVLVNIKSILFVELLGDIGDFLTALPAIHAIAKSHPDAHLSVLTFASNAELLEKDSMVSKTLIAPPLRNEKEYWEQADFLRDLLAREYFDLIVSDTMFGGIARLVESSGSKRKVSNLWRDLSENELIEEQFLSTLFNEGLVDAGFRDMVGRIALSDEEQQWARVWLHNNVVWDKRVAVLHPETDKSVRRWPPQRFIELGKWLTENADFSVVVSTVEDVRLTKEIAAGVGHSASVLPPTHLRKFAALVGNVDVFVSADANVARVAASAGSEVVALFGPVWSGRYGLRRPNINVQSPRQCSEQRPIDFTQQSCWHSGICVFPEVRSCMEYISVETVIDSLKDRLEGV